MGEGEGERYLCDIFDFFFVNRLKRRAEKGEVCGQGGGLKVEETGDMKMRRNVSWPDRLRTLRL